MAKLASAEIDSLIERTLSGDTVAREKLFAYVQEFVTSLELRQLGPYSRDPDCIAEVCVRVVTRFVADDHRRLRLYLDRPERCFSTFLRVVACRVAIDLARGMRQNIAARREPVFRWAREVELVESNRTTSPSAGSKAQLLDVRRFLRTQADPLDVDLLECWIASPQSWTDIARRHNLSPNAARQRVSRLRKSLRAWLDRDGQ